MLKLWLQYLLPGKWISRAAGNLADLIQQSVKHWLIKNFVHAYKVDLSEAIDEDYHHYPSFNAFFARRLKPGRRLIDASEETLISPIDGVVYATGEIGQETEITAKGQKFTLSEFLGELPPGVDFFGGKYLIGYLSPKDYHRVHLPCDGTLDSSRYFPGKLFSVAPEIMARITGVLARNERLVTFWRHPNLGIFAVVMVGAMVVGRIKTVWGFSSAAVSGNKVLNYQHEGCLTLKKGEELGHFELGSTIGLFFQRGKVVLNCPSGTVLRMGTKIGTLL